MINYLYICVFLDICLYKYIHNYFFLVFYKEWLKKIYENNLDLLLLHLQLLRHIFVYSIFENKWIHNFFFFHFYIEWLKKISEVNPAFAVVTFTDTHCTGVYVEQIKD